MDYKKKAQEIRSVLQEINWLKLEILGIGHIVKYQNSGQDCQPIGTLLLFKGHDIPNGWRRYDYKTNQ